MKKEKEPELAPFFLPTVAASDDVRRSVFDPSRESLVNADGDSKKSQTEPKSRILRAGSDLAGVASTPLISLLKKAKRRMITPRRSNSSRMRHRARLISNSVRLDRGTTSL